ncbi:MAG TPA: cytochrome P450, partial [Mycobacterium sp.]
MGTPAAIGNEAEPALPAVRMPPGPSTPKTLQALLFVKRRREFFDRLARRYDGAFTIHAAVFGPTVVVADPELARQVFLAGPDNLRSLQPNHGRLLGSGSVFALDGAEHRRRRDLFSPFFHGERLRGYEPVFVEETLREIAGWPDGRRFATHAPMKRITVNAILRTVFGAQPAQLDELRRIIGTPLSLGAKLARMPMPSRSYGRFTPWGRLAEGRRRYEAAVDELIAQARTDPTLADRTDVLALMLRSPYSDGTMMSRKEIGDELLAMYAASQESVAATLAWVFERISRRPQLLAELVAEADAGGNTLRRATIREVQRTSVVSDFVGRNVCAPVFELGPWRIPRRTSIMVAIAAIHRNSLAFPDPDRFDPQRFLTGSPSAFEWLPYGGGSRRCPGSSFASLQMDVALRTVLQHFSIEPTAARAERPRCGGLNYAPGHGGR